MKLPETLKPSRLFAKDRRGVALVTVLTVMALTTILVLTFFSLATSEHRASNTYSNGLQAQQVGEQAVNFVIAQIREATTVGTSKAWASQPGAIRQWDQGGTTSFAYKLYSDDQMKTEDWNDFQNDFMALKGWSSKPSHFVDLNEPVIRGEKVYYPIVHPNASSIPQWPQALGNDQDGVEGFSYNMLPGRQLAEAGDVGAMAATVAKSRDGHVAMPVRWIYQLADGTLGVLNDSGGGGTAASSFRVISGNGKPSEKNPMVARFAFWADDETTKLNVNTHAGGLAWDVPKTGGELDMNMGKYQPAQHEWQRYPGHPASTHLIPALAPGVLDIVNDRDAMEMLFKVVPRIVGGGSESGTRIIDTRRKEEENGLVADKEPLFPSLDDVIMRSDRKPHEFPDAKGRPIPASDLSEYLERAKFFITANSRAPETNMFNLPRVAIWPIYNAAYDDPEYQTKLTPFDRLIHYCASLGQNTNGFYPRHEYIFRRENADSTTHDYNIDRNNALYNYLLELLEKPVPGYGNSFQNKYAGGDHQQILTEIFDYIRTTNLHDDSIFNDFEDAFVEKNTSEHPTYTNPRDSQNSQVGHKGHGQVVPIRIGDTKGMGRFYTLGSAQVQVISCAEPGDIPVPKNFGATSYTKRKDQPQSNPDSPGQGYYLNFPPHPAGFNKPGDLENPGAAYLAVEPDWLRHMREAAAAPGASARAIDLFNQAFNPEQWNWQLAYLDQIYLGNVLSEPSLAKFSRLALNKDNFKLGMTRLKGMDPFDDPRNAEQLVQGVFLFNLFTPSVGWGSINPDMEVKIEVLRNSTNAFMYFNTTSEWPGLPLPLAKAQFLGFVPGIAGNKSKDEWIFATNRLDSAWGGRRYGGLMPYEYLLTATANFNQMVRRSVLNLNDGSLASTTPSINRRYEDWHKDLYADQRYDLYRNRASQDFIGGYQYNQLGGRARLTPLDRGYDQISTYDKLNSKTAQSYRYDLVTIPFKVPNAEIVKNSDGSFKEFIPGQIDFRGGDVKFSFYHGGEYSEYSMPQGEIGGFGNEGGEIIQEITLEIPDFEISAAKGNNKEKGTSGRYHPVAYDRNRNLDYRAQLAGYYNEFDGFYKDSFSLMERISLGTDPGNPYAVKYGSSANRTTDARISLNESGMKPPVPSGRFAHLSVEARPTLFSPGDIVQSVEIRHGDARIVAGRAEIKKGELFSKHRMWEDSPMAHTVTNATGGAYLGAKIENDYIILPKLATSNPYNGKVPLPFGVEKSIDVQKYGDFDNGAGLMIDGPYINKPDEGNVHSLKAKYMRTEIEYWESRRNYGEFPYFNREDIQESGGPAYFSPNRLVSGPGMFGSLPTGVLSDTPWRTLLFRPEIKNGTVDGFLRHPGGDSPPDHLIMDLFWMPIVEPYAISEPLSTAGKVNLNFDIVPFQHIQRSTALRGVFRSELILCIPNKWHLDYKHNYGRGRNYHWRDNPYGGTLQGKRLRAAIREDDTIDQFYQRFNNGGDIFKSATEICEIHLIPEEVSSRLKLGSKGSIESYVPNLADMDTGKYWKDHSLVGDNSKERPYTNIQNRITTKSNTFLVHYRAQVLKQARRDDDGGYAEWRPTTDTVQAEYRGSSIVERYVNPEGDDIPDFAHGNLDGLDAYFRYRVVNPRRFAP